MSIARTMRGVRGDVEGVSEVGDGIKICPFKLDVSNPDEVKGFVSRLPEEFREIDVLVNNA